MVVNGEEALRRPYTDLERVLGTGAAEVLMAHLPTTPIDSLATREDMAGLDSRMDGLDS